MHWTERFTWRYWLAAGAIVAVMMTVIEHANSETSDEGIIGHCNAAAFTSKDLLYRCQAEQVAKSILGE